MHRHCKIAIRNVKNGTNSGGISIKLREKARKKCTLEEPLNITMISSSSIMYGSLDTTTDEEDAPAASPLLASTKKKKKKSRNRRFKTAAQAARATRRIQQKPIVKPQPGVLGNIFPEEHGGGMKRSPSTATTIRTSPTSSRPPHSFVYTMLNPRSRQWQALLFKKFLYIVIISDMVMFILSTEPSMKHRQALFYTAEGVTSSIFLIEYIARFITCTECHRYSKYGPILGRLRWMCSFSALIDALATFPWFIELILKTPLPRFTYLRFFRLMRIMRTDSFSKAADTCWRVIYYNREILHVAAVLCIYLVLFTAVLLYFLRPQGKHAPHEGFQSIGATMYMSTLMLTGQGGPEGDLPWYTKGIVLLTGVFSIGMFAIPASMLTWGFEAEAQRVAARSRKRFKQQKTGSFSSTSSSSSSDTGGDSSSSSVSTSDEEYLKIIAGDDEEDEDILADNSDSDQQVLQDLLNRFRSADTDRSGSLTKREFLEIAQSIQQQYSSQSQRELGVVASTGADDSTSAADVAARMDTLEKKVDATNAMLDQLLKKLS